MSKIKAFIKRILKADIVKVFSLNAVSTLIRMCTGLVSVKVVSTIIGPSGIALLGQLNNFNTILQGVAGGGVGSGVTKYIAEYKYDEMKIRGYISNALRISIIFTTIISFICILFSNQFSENIMMSPDYGYVFVVLGFTIFFFTLNTLLVNILNGYKEFKKYVAVNICSSVFGLVFSVILCVLWGLEGAMINAVTFQSVVFFITLYQCRKCLWFKKENFTSSRDKIIIKQYLQYTLMTLVALSIVPVTQMVLRGYVISEISITEAGWWEGMNRISAVYLSIITTSLSIYILPRMSELTDRWELKQEIIRCYKLIIPLLLVCTVAIFFLRRFIVWLLFTSDFYPMENLFIWQLLGDFFKMCSWLLAYLMLAKAKTKLYIFSEIFFGTIMLGISYFCVRVVGTVGLNIGYMINYFIYLTAMVIGFRNILFCKKPINS